MLNGFVGGGAPGANGAPGADGAAAAPTTRPAVLTGSGTLVARSFQRYSLSAPATFTLPTASGLTVDDAITLVEIGGAVFAATIDGAGSETVQGALTQILNEAYQNVTLVPDGTSAWAALPRF